MEKINKTIIRMMQYVADVYYEYAWDRKGTFLPPHHYGVMVKGQEASDLSTKIFDLQDMYSIAFAQQYYEKYKMRNDGIDVRSYESAYSRTGINETREFNLFRDKLLSCFVISEALNQDKNIEEFSRDFLMKLFGDGQIIYLDNFFNSDNINYSIRTSFKYSYGEELNGLDGIDKLIIRCSDYVKIVLFDYLVEKLLGIYNEDSSYVIMTLDKYLNGKNGENILKGDIRCFPKDQTIDKIVKLLSSEDMLRILKFTAGDVEHYVGNYCRCHRDKDMIFESDKEQGKHKH